LRTLLLLVTGIVLALLIGCATSTKKTDLIPVPPAKTGGTLRIMLAPEENMTKEDAAFLKTALIDTFGEAGFESVAVVKARKNSDTELDIKVVIYEQTATGNHGCVVAGTTCSSICICLAPCLMPAVLSPEFYDDQLTIAADVSGFRSGRRIFTDRIKEEGHLPASAMNAGGVKKEEVQKLTINNFVARIMDRINK
jgi:hypothetical protein